LIGASKDEIISLVALKVNALEINNYHVTRLHKENINRNLFTEELGKLKVNFADYKIKKFINLPESMLPAYVNFLNNFGEDFPSIMESTEIAVTAEDFIEQRKECIRDNRERITYLMYNKDYELIACSNLEASKKIIFTALTGVRKDFRRKGIAKFLKIHSILDMSESNPDFQYFQTRTNFKNTPMYNLNEQLGFKVGETAHEFVIK
jgi:hypothetical protein